MIGTSVWSEVRRPGGRSRGYRLLAFDAGSGAQDAAKRLRVSIRRDLGDGGEAIVFEQPAHEPTGEPGGHTDRPPEGRTGIANSISGGSS
jgi:hypothetical protein